MTALFVFLLVVHVLASFFLIVIVLVQGGRGGLGEALGGAAAQSLFGGGTNLVMAKITTIAAMLFAATCLSLAVLSTARGRSVIEQVPELAVPEALPLLPGVAVPADPTMPAASSEDHAHSHEPAAPEEQVLPAAETAPADAATSAP